LQLRTKPIAFLSQQFRRTLLSYSSHCYNTSSCVNSLRCLMVVYFLLQRNLVYTEKNVVTTRLLVRDYHFMRKHRHYTIVSFKLCRPTIILDFYVHGSVHHKSILISVQRDATIRSLYFTARSLYMFWVLSTPIIRST